MSKGILIENVEIVSMKKKVAIIGVTGSVGQEFVQSLDDHPWFLGCQFHPELTSNPKEGHPIFNDFIKASSKK